MNAPTPASTTITPTMATTDIRNDPKAAKAEGNVVSQAEMMSMLKELMAKVATKADLQELAKKADQIEFDLHPESVCPMCVHAG